MVSVITNEMFVECCVEWIALLDRLSLRKRMKYERDRVETSNYSLSMHDWMIDTNRPRIKEPRSQTSCVKSASRSWSSTAVSASQAIVWPVHHGQYYIPSLNQIQSIITNTRSYVVWNRCNSIIQSIIQKQQNRVKSRIKRRQLLPTMLFYSSLHPKYTVIHCIPFSTTSLQSILHFCRSSSRESSSRGPVYLDWTRSSSCSTTMSIYMHVFTLNPIILIISFNDQSTHTIVSICCQ